MRVCAIGDTHGLHKSLEIRPSDILCIAGDISPLWIQDQKDPMLKWLKEEFLPWCEEIKVNKIFLTPGNHDFVFYNCEEETRELFRNTKAEILIDELGVYDGYKIWGTPWCSVFGNWAYMQIPEFEYKQFAKMPSDLDILISHDPPYGACDICLQHPYGNKGHLGNSELAKVMIKKHPKVCVCGHLHTGASEEMLGETKVYNVSVINEQYKIYRDPLYFEYGQTSNT